MADCPTSVYRPSVTRLRGATNQLVTPQRPSVVGTSANRTSATKTTVATSHISRPWGRLDSRRCNSSSALAEPDARVAAPLAVAAQDHLVAVLEKRALLAAGKRERLGAPPGALEETSPRFLGLTGHRTAGEKIAGAKVAAVARVMGEQLRDGPVHVGEAADAHAKRLGALGAHALGRQADLERDVETGAIRVVLGKEIG